MAQIVLKEQVMAVVAQSAHTKNPPVHAGIISRDSVVFLLCSEGDGGGGSGCHRCQSGSGGIGGGRAETNTVMLPTDEKEIVEMEMNLLREPTWSHDLCE